MKNVYEVFNEVAAAKNDADKINILRFNSNLAVREVLRGTFHPDIQFVFETLPVYKPSNAPPGLGYSSLMQEMKRAYIFVKNGSNVDPNLTLKRKEQILVQILEALEAQEAKVFLNMLKKKQEVKGLTYKVVKEAFPDLIP